MGKLKELKPVDKEAIRRATVDKKANNSAVVNLANKIRGELLSKMKSRTAKGRYTEISESDEEDSDDSFSDY